MGLWTEKASAQRFVNVQIGGYGYNPCYYGYGYSPYSYGYGYRPYYSNYYTRGYYSPYYGGWGRGPYWGGRRVSGFSVGIGPFVYSDYRFGGGRGWRGWR
jgi:hypothetical protein